MPLDAGDLFARVVALLFSAVSVLHALRVNDQKAGHGVAPPGQSHFKLRDDFVLKGHGFSRAEERS
jgi:hypothetical protein